MKAERGEAGRRWLAAAGGAIVVVAAVGLLVRVPPSPTFEPLAPAKPAIQFGSDVALNEQAELHDQRPLFLPTSRNVALKPPARPEAGRTVLNRDELKLTFADASVKLGLPQPVTVPERPIDALLTDTPQPLYGFGRVDPPVGERRERGGFVEARTANSNVRVLGMELPTSARPPTEKPWRPLEFLAMVDAAGLAAPLMILERSDVDEVDSYFRNYLAQTFRVGERLPPGTYRVVVGP